MRAEAVTQHSVVEAAGLDRARLAIYRLPVTSAGLVTRHVTGPSGLTVPSLRPHFAMPHPLSYGRLRHISGVIAMYNRIATLTLISVALLFTVDPASAQSSFFKKAQEAAKQALDGVKAVEKAVPGADEAGTAQSTPAENSSGTTAPGTGVWANYDFVSGDRVLFYHDFESSRTGNFPSRLEYLAGNLDVVELDNNKVLRAGDGTSENGPGGSGCFTIVLPETLPERYTIEYRIRTSDPLSRATVYLFSDGSDNTPDTRCNYPPKTHIFVNRHAAGLQFPDGAKSSANRGLPTNEWVDVRIAVDGPYWKMYLNEQRVANVPRYEFPRARKLHVFMNVYRYSVFLDDLRIAEGGPRSLYDDLQAAGFVSTTAIRFDSGSATLKPESTGILSDVRDMLKEHADLQLTIEGHTDSQGADDANLQLSKRRASAVKEWLVANSVDAGRLEVAGRGESDPAADNGTAEGMAQNRRVVFRKR